MPALIIFYAESLCIFNFSLNTKIIRQILKTIRGQIFIYLFRLNVYISQHPQIYPLSHVPQHLQTGDGGGKFVNFGHTSEASIISGTIGTSFLRAVLIVALHNCTVRERQWRWVILQQSLYYQRCDGFSWTPRIRNTCRRRNAKVPAEIMWFSVAVMEPGHKDGKVYVPDKDSTFYYDWPLERETRPCPCLR